MTSKTTLNLNDLLSLRRYTKSLIALGKKPSPLPLAGLHRGRSLGRGYDYEESREYQVGDDVRMINWSMTARQRTPYTKLYREDRERPLMIVVDLRPNMKFATQGMFKSVMAAHLATLLIWKSYGQNDPVGLAIMGQGVVIPPQNDKSGIIRLLKSMVSSHAATQNNNDNIWKKIRYNCPRNSQVIIFSDFLDLPDQDDLPIIGQQFDGKGVMIYDHIEKHAPGQRLPVIVQGGQIQWDTRFTKTAKDHEMMFSSRLDHAQKLCLRSGFGFTDIACDHDTMTALEIILS